MKSHLEVRDLCFRERYRRKMRVVGSDGLRRICKDETPRASMLLFTCCLAI
jgi:hypothetical protein